MAVTPPIRVVLADDHQLFRSGLRQLIELESDLTVIAEADNGHEAIHAVDAHRPDVLLLDLSMPVLDGVAALSAIRRDYPDVGVLILTMHGEEGFILRALDAGAHGFIRKDADSADVLEAIRVVARGGSWIEPRAAVVLLDEYRRLRSVAGPASRNRLSERDITFLRLLAGGRSNKEIAAAIGLAESTVKNQLAGLFERIGVNDRTQAALYAVSRGILTVPEGSDASSPRQPRDR